MGVIGRVRLRVAVSLAAAVVSTLGPWGGAGAATDPGPLDAGFGNGGKLIIPPPPGANEYGNAAAALADGSLVVAGTAIPDPDALPASPSPPPVPLPPEAPSLPSFPSWSTSLGSVFMLYRVLPDGSLDENFGNRGRVWTDLYKAENRPVGDQIPERYPIGSSGGYALAVQPDGRIIVAGTTASTTSFAFALVRYLPDGRIDRSFGNNGLVVTDLDPLHPDAIGALALTPDGRILAGGVSGQRAALARYHGDGAIDASFGGDGIVFTKEGFLGITALALAPGGRIIAAGQGGYLDGPYDFALARYHPDGILDTTLGGGGVVLTDLGATGESAAGLALGPGGTIVSAGSSSGAFALVRHQPDGSLDRTFGRGGLVTATGPAAHDSGTGRAFLEAPAGRIIMAGGRWGGASRAVAVVRYEPDGSRDMGFGVNGLITTDVVADRDDEAYAVVLGREDRSLSVAGTSYKDAGEKAQVFVVRYRFD